MQTARENNGYTQEAFAEALEVGVEHYRKIEPGMCGLVAQCREEVMDLDYARYLQVLFL